MSTSYLGKCGTVFPVLRYIVQTVSVYVCSIEINQFFPLEFYKFMSLFCVGVGCDVSNDHMKRTKFLLFPSTWAWVVLNEYQHTRGDGTADDDDSVVTLRSTEQGSVQALVGLNLV